MQQYFYDDIIQSDTIKLSQQQIHHIKNVIKLKPQSQVRVVDKLGQLFIGEVDYREDVVITNLQLKVENNELPVKITLIAALIKKDKWEFLLQKASELGVYKIVGLQSKRCVVKLDEKKAKKLARWSTITMEACEQARRTHKTIVEDIIDFEDLSKYQTATNVIAYEDILNTSKALKAVDVVNNEITIVIGPEGGFTPEEITYAKQLGFETINLGKRILRAETAAIVAVNTIGIMYE